MWGHDVKRVLITGGDDGIGLELVRQYLEAGWRVYATCRSPMDAESLHDLEKIHTRLSLHRLDITVPEDLNKLIHQFSDTPLDLLINSSAVFLDKENTGLDHLDYERWFRTLEINTLGPLRVIEALIDNIEAATNGINLVVVLSILPCRTLYEEESTGLFYNSSKAALNSAMQDIAKELEQRNVGLLMLYPGPVAEDMKSPQSITTRQSVTGMRQVIADYSPAKNGCFYSYDGSEFAFGQMPDFKRERQAHGIRQIAQHKK